MSWQTAFLVYWAGSVVKLGHSRVMIVKMQWCAVKEGILKIFRKECVLDALKVKQQIFLELTSEIAKKRARFHEIRGRLRSAGIKHWMIHPATWFITFRVETKQFTDHVVAERGEQTRSGIPNFSPSAETAHHNQNVPPSPTKHFSLRDLFFFVLGWG